jgi:hypothetical protein
MNSPTLPVIRASELGQHAYCARSWWLGRVKGYASAHTRELAWGRDAHQQHGRGVVRYQRLQLAAYALVGIAILVAAVGVYLLGRGF